MEFFKPDHVTGFILHENDFFIRFFAGMLNFVGPGVGLGGERWFGASLPISALSRFRPRATSHFCFGKSDQNH